MGKTYDYSAASTTIEIKNVIDVEKYKACDAGTPVKKVVVTFKSIKDKPCAKFDYLFADDGSFLTYKAWKEQTAGTITDATDDDFVVALHTKYKTTDRDVPAYRTMNKKVTLAVGDSMKFNTTKKDEIVFYEKFAEAFAGELEVKIGDKVVGKDYGDVE